MINSAVQFGFNSTLVEIERDIRDGKGSFDVVGIKDSVISETKKIIRANYSHPALFDEKRVLVAATPCDCEKDGTMAFPILAALETIDNPFVEKNRIAVFGDLSRDGIVYSQKAIYFLVKECLSLGVKYFVMNEKDAKAVCELTDCICVVNSVNEIHKITDESNYHSSFYEPEEEHDSVCGYYFPKAPENFMTNHLSFGVAVAVAGKLDLIAIGRSGNGKTLAINGASYMQPSLSEVERRETRRIYSTTGLDYFSSFPPFRMPHQAVSVEGMSGGGHSLNAGEVSLAHNGILFLDEVAEFRTSVLAIVKMVSNRKNITLSRTGRITCYPARFQLFISSNPCACGNFGAEDRVCLCSAHAVEMFQKKGIAPFVINTEVFLGNTAFKKYSLKKLREMIVTSRKIQNEFGKAIKSFSLEDFKNHADSSIFREAENFAEKCSIPTVNILRTALTVATMKKRRVVTVRDLHEAFKLFEPLGNLFI